MSEQRPNHGSSKRKQAMEPHEEPNAKKSRQADNDQPLLAPHRPILVELAPKYNVLPASVISSTQIRKRVTHIANHLVEQSEKQHIAVLYARTAEVAKLITVVEQCKRVLKEEGKPWYQYNQLFELPEDKTKAGVVEETILAGDEEDDSESDQFETMKTRFEEALLPRPPTRTAKSLRVFLSTTSIPELRSKDNITLQTSDAK